MNCEPFPNEIDNHQLKLADYNTVVDITFPDGETWGAYYNLNSVDIDYDREPSQQVKNYLASNFGYFLPIMERQSSISFASEKVALQYLADMTGKKVKIGISKED